MSVPSETVTLTLPTVYADEQSAQAINGVESGRWFAMASVVLHGGVCVRATVATEDKVVALKMLETYLLVALADVRDVRRGIEADKR